MAASNVFTSVHFQLQELAQGVFAAVAAKDGLAIGNAGIIDLGDQTLIFDTFEDPICALDLRRAAETVTGRPATYIVNSHLHPDHWYGNQVFDPATPIFATPITFEGMAEYVAEVLEAQADPSEYDAWLDELEGQRAAATDSLQRQNLEIWIRRVQGNRNALATLELRRPNILFEEQLTFQGTKRRVELVTWGGAHTDSDAMLFLPEEQMVFTADICFFHRQPYMAAGNFDNWMAQLQRLAATGYECFVPGHGPPGSVQEIRLLQDYFKWLEGAVLQAARDGESVEEFLARPMPNPFAAWSAGGLPSEGNVRMMFEVADGNRNV